MSCAGAKSMTEYDYLVIDPAGRERGGRVPAATLEEARQALEAKSLYVVRLNEGSSRTVNTAPLLSGGRFQARGLSGKQLSLFTRQLATLIQVTPLEESLRTIAIQSETARVQDALSSVHTGVFEGRRLADAMGREPKSFPALYRATISAGESTGALPQILERLAVLLERQAAIRSKIFSAIAYPIVLTIVALFVVIALMTVVVPKVVAQFDDIGQELPLITRIVMGLSDLLANWWWAFAILLVAAGVAARFALQKPDLRLRFDTWLLRLPLLGTLIRDVNAARIARTLSTMVASRLPLTEGLALTSQTIGNHRIKRGMEEIAESVRGGGSLSAGLKRVNLFPPLLVYLAASGESAGQLEVMLERAADYLEREFDSFTSAALSILEPAIIVVMGAIVAMIILSILLPILQLQSLAGI